MAITDLRGNTIPAAFDALPANVGMIRSGELRALASPRRSVSLALQVLTLRRRASDVIVELGGPSDPPGPR
jgi:hypothetical protein